MKIYIYIYIYIYSRDNTYVFSKKKLILYSICICIDIALLRTVADDVLKCEKTEKWCLSKLTGHKGFVKGSHTGDCMKENPDKKKNLATSDFPNFSSDQEYEP